MQNRKIIVRPILFILICALVFLGLFKVLDVSNTFSEHAEMMINGYYDFEDNSVDAVFLGNSHTYRYWQSAFAWNEMGLATASWSTSNMPCGAARAVTKEMFKTQSPKVLCVEASMFQRDSADSNNKIYLLLSSMKESRTKYEMIKDFCDYNDITGKEKLQYYLPFIQFHSRWYEINEGDFRQTQKSYLNSCYQKEFLEKTASNMIFTASTERKSIDENTERVLRDYLDYCKSLDCEVLFFFSPVWSKEKKVERYNYIQDIIEDYGYSVINFNDPKYYEMIGLDEETDIQDKSHTNVKGSIKFTRTMGELLKERYGLSDRSGEASYEKWNQAASEYYDMVLPYMNE